MKIKKRADEVTDQLVFLLGVKIYYLKTIAAVLSNK